MPYIALILAVLLLPLTSAQADYLKLGAIVPLSGPASLMGESLSGVVKLAKLTRVSAELEDDRCEAKTALSAYHKLRGRGVRIFYMACSGSILAVAPLAKRNGDLILTSYAGSAKIRDTKAEVLRFNPDAISIAANYQEPDSVRAKLLEGFPGRFATYSLTTDGEVQNGGDYLTVVRY